MDFGHLEVLPSLQHPFLARKELIQPKKGRPHLKEGFQLLTMRLEESQPNEVVKVYTKATQHRWLVCWPLLDSDHKLVGIVDMLIQQPLSSPEQTALKDILGQLAVQTCLSFERSRLRQTMKVARELTVLATQHLRAFHAQEVYSSLVKRAREEFSCAHCDLYFSCDGQFLLRATTRSKSPHTEVELFDDQIKGKSLGDCVRTCAASQKGQLQHADIGESRSSNRSQNLSAFLDGNHLQERIAIPLFFNGTEDHPDGVLCLSGPARSSEKGVQTWRFTAQDLRLALDLTVVQQRIIQMARLQEQQEWLVNELLHALGQPLQVLSGVMSEMVREIYQSGKPKEAVDLKGKSMRAFEMIQEERDQLQLYAWMNHPQTQGQPMPVDLAGLVKRCSRLLEEEAKQNKQKIEFSVVGHVQPIPAYEGWLRKAVFNLLHNAVKYSYCGETIDIELSESRDGEIRLSISNYGIGIPPDDLQRIFDPYFRSNVPDPKKLREGTGIGLAVVKEAIEYIHMGKVVVTSDSPRSGSTEVTALAIRDIPFKTNFTVILWRNKLQSIVADNGGNE